MKLFRWIALLVCCGTAAGCLDPTTGTPPPVGAPVPAFQARTALVSAAGLGSTWRTGCPVAPSALRRLTVDYWGFDGRRHTGDLIVHSEAAAALVKVLHRLYDVRYPIHRVHPVDYYGGSDDRSMAADNTSAFNCRWVTGTTTVWSEHSYGKALDLSPVENPYVKGTTVLPPAGRPYANRSLTVPSVLHAGDPVVGAFAAIGWSWGGAWRALKDYQHFSLSGH